LAGATAAMRRIVPSVLGSGTEPQREPVLTEDGLTRGRSQTTALRDIGSRQLWLRSDFHDAPKRDAIRMNRHRALGYCLSMILSENRYALFRIML